MKKKIALLLAAIMMISLMPMTVFAAGTLPDRTKLNPLHQTGRTPQQIIAQDEKVFTSDGKAGDLTKGIGGTFLSYTLMNGIDSTGFVAFELKNAVWSFPDKGAHDETEIFRVDDNMFIAQSGNTSSSGLAKIYAIEQVTSTYARVTFFDYQTNSTATRLPKGELPTASALYAANVAGVSSWALKRAAATNTDIILLPLAIKYPDSGSASDYKPQIRVTESGITGITVGTDDSSLTSGFFNLFDNDADYTRSRTGSLYDEIKVFYYGTIVTDRNDTINLGRVSIQEHVKGINRFSVGKDYQFTVLPVHPIAATYVGGSPVVDGNTGTGYVRRYVTLTAPEGYYWDYETNLYNLVKTGQYNLLFNPTGIFALADKPAWLMVDQVRNNVDKRSNELVLDLDFAAFPPATFDDIKDSSFEIAPNMLKLVKTGDYVVETGDVPVKLTISDYDNSHIATQFFNVAKFSAGTSVTLTSAGTGEVLGGAYGFADNAVQSAETGTPVGTVTWKEGSNDKAGSVETVTFTFGGATLVGAKVSYIVNSDAPIKFTSDSRDYIPVGRVAYEQAYTGGAYITDADRKTVKVNADNTITVNKVVDKIEDKAITIVITPYFVGSVDPKTTDITATATNLTNPTTLNIGKVVAPVVVNVASAASGVLGKDIKGGTLTITEAKAGVINSSNYQPVSATPEFVSQAIARKELTVTLQNDVFGQLLFMPNLDNLTSHVTILEGTGTGLVVSNARTDANGVLHVEFAGKSTIAATIQIKDIPFAANRLTYNGNYAAFVGGTAIAANYNNNVIVNTVSPLDKDVKVSNFVSISDSNIGTGSIDSVDDKELIAQITVEKDGDVTTGSVTDVITNISTELDPSPIITGGRTYIPLRAVSATLGVAPENVTWDAQTNTAAIESDGRVVYFTKNSKEVAVFTEGVGITPIVMDAAAFNLNGSMYIPVRYLVQGLFDGTAQENASSTANNRIIDIYSGL